MMFFRSAGRWQVEGHHESSIIEGWGQPQSRRFGKFMYEGESQPGMIAVRTGIVLLPEGLMQVLEVIRFESGIGVFNREANQIVDR